MTTDSCRSKECSETSAQQEDIVHLDALRSVSFGVAGFAALLVGEEEAPNPDRLLIFLVSSGRLVSDITERRPYCAAVQWPENKVGRQHFAAVLSLPLNRRGLRDDKQS